MWKKFLNVSDVLSREQKISRNSKLEKTAPLSKSENESNIKGAANWAGGINHWNPNYEKINISNSFVNHHPTVERKT